MKRIIAALICVVMCCASFLISSGAETFESVFTISEMQLMQWGYDRNGTFVNEISKVGTTSFTSGVFNFTYPVSISGNYVYLMGLVFAGTWSNIDQYDTSKDGTSFLTVEYAINMEVKNNNDQLYLQYYSTQGDLELIPYNYAVLSTQAGYTYISYNIDNAYVDLFYTSGANFILSLPLGRRLPLTITTTPPIQGSVYNIKFTKEFDEPLPDLSEELQIIIGNQVDIKTILADMPSQIVDKISDAQVGDPYTGVIDTAEIVAYESAYNKVMDEVDVDQVVHIMDSGVSLNQAGMYNDQSFDSVSGLMTNIIDTTGLMPLITLTLTLGLACFIIGRSGKL